MKLTGFWKTIVKANGRLLLGQTKQLATRRENPESLRAGPQFSPGFETRRCCSLQGRLGLDLRGGAGGKSDFLSGGT